MLACLVDEVVPAPCWWFGTVVPLLGTPEFPFNGGWSGADQLVFPPTRPSVRALVSVLPVIAPVTGTAPRQPITLAVNACWWTGL